MTCTRGWSERCAHSRGKRCKCKCGGANHGAAIEYENEIASFARRGANYVTVRQDAGSITIRDLGPWDKYPTVTNDAEHVVARMIADDLGSRRLFYYDSDGRLDELLVRNGKFAGYAPVDTIDLGPRGVSRGTVDTRWSTLS